MEDDLSGIFWAHRADDARPAELPDIAQLLSDLYRRGATAWPEVTLPAEDFVRHLALHAPAGEVMTALESLHCADLYLACACAQGIAAAIEAFDQSILRRVPEFLARVDRTPAFGDEVQQVLRTRLLVRAEGDRAKIGGYAGRGNLLSWTRMTALREAVHLKQRGNREREYDQEDWSAALPAGVDPEIDYLKARYKLEFEQALREAIAALTGEKRTLLRLHHHGGLTTIKLAAMYKVHQSTASRWLKACHQELRQQTEALLRERLRLSPAEFESLSRLVRSQLDVSLTLLLPESDC